MKKITKKKPAPNTSTNAILSPRELSFAMGGVLSTMQNPWYGSEGKPTNRTATIILEQ